ncbi:hypothetical protein B0A69_17585 [Chryseobacterium shigense]|uniref:Uncharacterized protein n=1 Tax=Chryseobacterium shigense TaxID=297244 RepID=A0A1N7ID18_9FLAO|nr:hypothetical protein [Chryseobacterium shigense]PQA91613.1 hypothetical protein B0A69_17585 [Chryseobacterium shigense]SIS34969.1 hypothetical protein SAMN05421639_103128 [Chryseobacterium shigense]
MKKILLGLALGLAALSSAQQYPNNGWGDDGYYQNGGGYTDEDDRNYFPDDYYYNYPQDYYPSDYYQGYYNDYRNSITNINWNVFFRENRLNRWQMDQIMSLNNLYVSFSTWDNFYRYNPDRWYYDRFYALERILGPRVFVVFQNNYYRGASPVAYFQNYRRTYYAPRYTVMPRYRNININVYRVDRSRVRRVDNPTFNVIRTSDRSNNGFRGPVRESGSSGGFRNQAGNRRDDSGGFRNENNGVRSNNGGGFRGNSENNGTRGGSGNNGGFRGSNEVKRENTPRRENNSGGFRGNNGSSRSENSTSSPQNQNSNGGGFRNRLVSNK